jgi:hypothetical protein
MEIIEAARLSQTRLLKLTATLVVVALAGWAVACGGKAGKDDLVPADTIRRTEAKKTMGQSFAGQLLPVGSSGRFDLNDALGSHDVSVTVRMARYDASAGVTPPDITGLLIDVRIENYGVDREIVDFNVFCGDGTERGRYVYDGPNAIDPLDGVPAGSYDEGTMLLGVAEGCRAGAVLSATLTGVFVGDSPQQLRWSLPAVP